MVKRVVRNISRPPAAPVKPQAPALPPLSLPGFVIIPNSELRDSLELKDGLAGTRGIIPQTLAKFLNRADCRVPFRAENGETLRLIVPRGFVDVVDAIYGEADEATQQRTICPVKLKIESCAGERHILSHPNFPGHKLGSARAERLFYAENGVLRSFVLTDKQLEWEDVFEALVFGRLEFSFMPTPLQATVGISPLDDAEKCLYVGRQKWVHVPGHLLGVEEMRVGETTNVYVIERNGALFGYPEWMHEQVMAALKALNEGVQVTMTARGNKSEQQLTSAVRLAGNEARFTVGRMVVIGFLLPKTPLVRGDSRPCRLRIDHSIKMLPGDTDKEEIYRLLHNELIFIEI